jgi:hypothetical protein
MTQLNTTLELLREMNPDMADEIKEAGGSLNKGQITYIAEKLPNALLLVRTNVYRVLIPASQCHDFLDLMDKQIETAKSLADIVYRTYGADRCHRFVKYTKELQDGTVLTEESVRLRMEMGVPGYNWVRDVSLPAS